MDLMSLAVLQRVCYIIKIALILYIPQISHFLITLHKEATTGSCSCVCAQE